MDNRDPLSEYVQRFSSSVDASRRALIARHLLRLAEGFDPRTTESPRPASAVDREFLGPLFETTLAHARHLLDDNQVDAAQALLDEGVRTLGAPTSPAHSAALERTARRLAARQAVRTDDASAFLETAGFLQSADADVLIEHVPALSSRVGIIALAEALPAALFTSLQRVSRAGPGAAEIQVASVVRRLAGSPAFHTVSFSAQDPVRHASVAPCCGALVVITEWWVYWKVPSQSGWMRARHGEFGQPQGLTGVRDDERFQLSPSPILSPEGWQDGLCCGEPESAPTLLRVSVEPGQIALLDTSGTRRVVALGKSQLRGATIAGAHFATWSADTLHVLNTMGLVPSTRPASAMAEEDLAAVVDRVCAHAAEEDWALHAALDSLRTGDAGLPRAYLVDGLTGEEPCEPAPCAWLCVGIRADSTLPFPCLVPIGEGTGPLHLTGADEDVRAFAAATLVRLIAASPPGGVQIWVLGAATDATAATMKLAVEPRHVRLFPRLDDLIAELSHRFDRAAHPHFTEPMATLVLVSTARDPAVHTELAAAKRAWGVRLRMCTLVLLPEGTDADPPRSGTGTVQTVLRITHGKAVLTESGSERSVDLRWNGVAPEVLATLQRRPSPETLYV